MRLVARDLLISKGDMTERKNRVTIKPQMTLSSVEIWPGLIVYYQSQQIKDPDVSTSNPNEFIRII